MKRLTNESPNKGFRLFHNGVHSELFLLPIITYPQQIGERETPSQDVKQTIVPMVARWNVAEQHLTHFAPLPYDLVSSMEPEMTRMHLHRIHDRSPKRYVQVPVVKQDLPSGAPHLFFHIFAASRKSCEPLLVCPAPWVASKAVEICQHSLYLESSTTFTSQGVMPIVLAPDHFQAALLRGLLTWLALMNDFGGIKAYSVNVSPESDDVVEILFALEEPEQTLRFQMRKSQLGIAGLTLLLLEMQSSFTCLDVPMDAPKSDVPNKMSRRRKGCTDSFR